MIKIKIYKSTLGYSYVQVIDGNFYTKSRLTGFNLFGGYNLGAVLDYAPKYKHLSSAIKSIKRKYDYDAENLVIEKAFL
jgi:hypothetical protein